VTRGWEYSAGRGAKGNNHGIIGRSPRNAKWSSRPARAGHHERRHVENGNGPHCPGYKALKSFTGTQPTPAPGGNPGVTPTEATSANASSGGIIGGLGDLLKGPLGGILAGASAGSVVNGGLSDLLNQFRKAGHGDAVGSWVGNGPNRPVSPADLTKVLDTDQINTLMSQSGLSRDELLAGLSDQLPRFVDHLTPNGRMPTDEEMSRLV
jgi:uncharacterized protein YidB (DUF937 family)